MLKPLNNPFSTSDLAGASGSASIHNVERNWNAAGVESNQNRNAARDGLTKKLEQAIKSLKDPRLTEVDMQKIGEIITNLQSTLSKMK